MKSLSFKANANDTMYISKAEAIANSEAWEFELDADDDENDPPEASMFERPLDRHALVS